jgi:hypothetical protein
MRVGGVFYLATTEGRFLRSTQAAGLSLSTPAGRTFFDVEDAGEGRVRIRSAHGDYLCACPDGAVRTSKQAAAWEAFTVEQPGTPRETRTPCLRSFHGTYLAARADGATVELRAERPGAGALVALDAFDADAHREAVRRARPPAAADRIIWTFWDRGADRMPPFYQLNVEGWRRLAPGWRIVALNLVAGDPLHVDNFVARGELPASFDALSPVVQSDAVRLALLKARGGVWMDASNLLTAGLDEICWDAIADRDGGTVMAGFCNGGWGSDHLGRRDCFESWFIATRPGNPLVERWHRAFVGYWNDRTVSAESWTHPLFECLDLGNFNRYGIDFRDYLLPHIAFRRVIEHDPHMRALWRDNTLLRDAGDEAFYLTQVVGWDARAIHRKLIDDPADDALADRLLRRPLMKFTSSMSTTLRELPAATLLDRRHTLGRIYAHILGGPSLD